MENKKSCIVYHNQDLDGKMSLEIVKLYLTDVLKEEDTVEYGYNYETNFDLGYLSDFDKIYIVDCCFPKGYMIVLQAMKKAGKIEEIVWIDHHISSMKEAEGCYDNLSGIRQVGIGACELCWTYLFPDKECPMAVQMLSAYDVWDKDRFNWDEDIIPFQYGMRVEESTVGISPILLKIKYPQYLIHSIIDKGRTILEYNKGRFEKQCNDAMEVELQGLKGIALNTQDLSSATFESVWSSDKYDFMLAFRVEDFNTISVSLYTDKDGIDVSDIAKKYGGGGHKQAAGFRVSVADFLDYYLINA